MLSINKFFLGALVVGSTFVACKKTDKADPLGNRGQNLVKVMDGDTSYVTIDSSDADPDNWTVLYNGVVSRNIEFIPESQTTMMLDIRRDNFSPDALNQPLTVTLKDDQDLLDSLNFNRDYLGLSTYEPLDPSLYSLVTTNGVTKTGNIYTVTFQPGEFAKEIQITVPDATQLDPSTGYAMPFTIMTSSAGTNISYFRSAVAVLGVKNKYDGVYDVTGTLRDVSSVGALFVHYTTIPNRKLFMALITTGPNTCDAFSYGLGAVGYLFSNNGAASFFGSFGLCFTFDPANGDAVTLHNYYGDPSKAATPAGNPALGTGAPLFAASNSRRAVVDPSGQNKFDVSGGTPVMRMKYWMIQPTIVSGGPRAFFNETWTYVGSR